jgi:acid phosphatase (class A)
MFTRRHNAFAALVLGLLLAGSARAADAPDTMGAAPAAKPTKVLVGLTARDLDPSLLLPPPPTVGSPAQAAELDELRRIQAQRTPDELAAAKWDDAHEDPSLYAQTLGVDLKTLPATAKLLALVDDDQAIAAGLAKKYFKRHRPWTSDDSLIGCERGKNPDPLTSYPSGHATLGYSLAVVLSALIPEKAQAIQARASEYAYHRMVCGVHYRSDIEASHALGEAVGVLMLHSPELRPQIQAAADELRAAHLTGR